MHMLHLKEARAYKHSLPQSRVFRTLLLPTLLQGSAGTLADAHAPEKWSARFLYAMPQQNFWVTRHCRSSLVQAVLADLSVGPKPPRVPDLAAMGWPETWAVVVVQRIIIAISEYITHRLSQRFRTSPPNKHFHLSNFVQVWFISIVNSYLTCFTSATDCRYFRIVCASKGVMQNNGLYFHG